MQDTSPSADSDHTAQRFATTHWTVVVHAGSQTPAARDALNELCQTYWHPLYAFVRRRGYAVHDAQDLVQSFLLDLIERSPFQKLSPEHGRFRSFLLASLTNFLASDWDRRRAAKRGGGTVFSLNDTAAEERYLLEPAAGDSPENSFDRRWARTVLDQALHALATEQAAAGKQALFETLRAHLTDATGRRDHAELAAQLGLTPNAVAVMVHRLRARYRELVRLTVAQTVAEGANVDEEMKHLLAAMRA